jgi:Flp pilus assembly protein TadG
MNVRESDRGAAIVEFALIATLLLTMMIGAFEGGRLFLLQAQLSSAAREAAREMAISGDEDAAQDLIDAAFPPTANPPGAYWDKGAGATCSTPPVSGENVEVPLSYETTFITGISGLDFTLRATGVMRCNG